MPTRVPAVLLGDRYYPRVCCHQHAAANRYVQKRAEDSVRYGSVHDRSQRFPIANVGGAVHGGCTPQEQDFAQGAQYKDVKMLHGEKADLSHLCVVRVRTFVHMGDSRKLDTAAWQGKVCGYSKKSKFYGVWNPKTHRVVESRNITFIETLPHLLPPPSKLSPLQDLVSPSWDLDDDTLDNDYMLYDDLLRDSRDYTGVLDFNANISANHKNTSSVLADLQMQVLFDQIRDLNRRDLLTSASSLPGAASLAEHLARVTVGPSSGGASPPDGGGASPKTGGLSPAPMPATARRMTILRNNRVPWPNVVTRRATAEPTGAVKRHKRVRTQQQEQEQEQEQEQLSGSGGTFPAEYTARAATTRSLHQYGQAWYCASA